MNALGFTWIAMAVITTVALIGWFRQIRKCDAHRRGYRCATGFEGVHQWAPWSKPYGVLGTDEKWQERRCQCGNRDFRPAPKVSA